MEGSTAPSTGQAKSVLGLTCRIDSTVPEATSVASLRWRSEPVTDVPWWASEARSGSPNGSATTSLSATAFCTSVSQRLATSWWPPTAFLSSALSPGIS